MANPNWKEDLTDISTRPDFKEITAKGGRAKSEKKSFALLVTNSALAKCKRCKLKCEFKHMNLERDSDCVCMVPTMRANAIRDETKVISLSSDRIEMYLGELIQMYRELLIDGEKFETEPKKKKIEYIRDINVMYNRLLQFKNAYHPPTQKSLNVNIDTTADKIIERIKQYKIKENDNN